MMSSGTLPTIPQWLSGKCILVTGASGYVGRILVEKLLYSCPDIDKIYILVRAKRDKTCEQRVKELLNRKALFDRVKAKDEKLLEKVVGIEGDVALKGLGLSEADRQTLQDNVAIFFHAAASVRFDQPLRDAILLNTRGTWETLELSKQMKRLEVYVYVSTAFSNCNYENVQEKVYKPKADWRKVITLAEKYPRDYLNIFSEKIIGKCPNTYIYTKAIAENIVDEYKDALPAVIYRPSVVAQCLREPIPGFIDKINSPGILVIGSAKGVLRALLGSKAVNYIPADTTVNAMIALAWYKGVYAPTLVAPSERRFVFNATTVKADPKLIQEYGMRCMMENPPEWGLWYPVSIPTDDWITFQIINILVHIVPGVIIDMILKIAGQKPMLLDIYRKLYLTMDHLKYFTCNEWSFELNNFYYLYDILKPSDKETFPIELDVDFYKSGQDTLRCGKEIVLNEPGLATDRAYFILKILYLVHQTFKWGSIAYIASYLLPFMYSWLHAVSTDIMDA